MQPKAKGTTHSTNVPKRPAQHHGCCIQHTLHQAGLNQTPAMQWHPHKTIPSVHDAMATATTMATANMQWLVQPCDWQELLCAHHQLALAGLPQGLAAVAAAPVRAASKP